MREEGSIFVFSLKNDSSGIDSDLIRDLSVESNSDLVFILSNVSIDNPGIYPNKVPGAEYHSYFSSVAIFSLSGLSMTV